MGRPVLFLHGWTMRGAVFDDVIERLGAEFDCAAPDLPGHASSGQRVATLDECATCISEELERWGKAGAVVVGWSMGAAAAWTYVERFGTGRLAGLVTVDMSPKIVSGPDWPHGLTGQDAKSVTRSTARFATDWDGATQGIATTMFANRDGAPGLSRENARQIILSQDPVQMRRLWSDMVAMDARSTVAQLDLPYLVCSGSLSRVYPTSASDWIARTATQARRHVFDRSGHSPHLEEPDAFAGVIREFACGLS